MNPSIQRLLIQDLVEFTQALLHGGEDESPLSY
jgi:hypothetical protein